MTERTHDLAALTTLTIAAVLMPLTPISVGTLGAVLIFNQFGSAFPDLDQPTAEFYRELPAGSLWGRLLAPILGGHRFVSHSILGILLIGYFLKIFLNYLGTFIQVDMELVWWAFILGYVSHLLTDSLTKDGVPLLFPLPIRFGIPPIRQLRIKTGKLAERALVYPALVLFNIYLVYSYYGKFAELVGSYIVR